MRARARQTSPPHVSCALRTHLTSTLHSRPPRSRPYARRQLPCRRRASAGSYTSSSSPIGAHRSLSPVCVSRRVACSHLARVHEPDVALSRAHRPALAIDREIKDKSKVVPEKSASLSRAPSCFPVSLRVRVVRAWCASVPPQPRVRFSVCAAPCQDMGIIFEDFLIVVICANVICFVLSTMQGGQRCPEALPPDSLPRRRKLARTRARARAPPAERRVLPSREKRRRQRAGSMLGSGLAAGGLLPRRPPVRLARCDLRRRGDR